MKVNIMPMNKDGEPNGYWEWYWYDGTLWYKGNYINGKRDGYWVWYDRGGKLRYKKYHIQI